MQQKMQTAVLAFYRKCGSSIGLRQILQQTVTLAAVVSAHSVDVAFKITVLDKFSERKLLKIRYSTGIKAKLVIKQRCQVRWQQHVADTEGWCQCFGKGVDIDNLFLGINAL